MNGNHLDFWAGNREQNICICSSCNACPRAAFPGQTSKLCVWEGPSIRRESGPPACWHRLPSAQPSSLNLSDPVCQMGVMPVLSTCLGCMDSESQWAVGRELVALQTQGRCTSLSPSWQGPWAGSSSLSLAALGCRTQPRIAVSHRIPSSPSPGVHLSPFPL